MADPGDIYFRALSNAGKSIGAGISSIIQQRNQLNQMDALINQGSRLQMSDITGNPNDKQPLISPKLLEQWTAAKNQHNARAEGAIAAFVNARTGLAFEGAKANLKQGQIFPITDQSGRLIGQQIRGRDVFFPEHIIGGGKGRTPAKVPATVHEKFADRWGLNVSDMYGQIGDLKYYDRTGQEVTGDTPPAVIAGTINKKPFRMSISSYDKLQNLRKKIPMMRTPGDAALLPEGAYFFDINGKLKRNTKKKGTTPATTSTPSTTTTPPATRTSSSKSEDTDSDSEDEDDSDSDDANDR